MKGFMRRRGDAWELRVYLGADPVTGKQRYASRTVRGGKRESQRVLNALVTEAERGLSVRTNYGAARSASHILLRQTVRDGKALRLLASRRKRRLIGSTSTIALTGLLFVSTVVRG